MISLTHRFLYVHIPKTAGNAVQNILREYSEDKIVCIGPHQDGIERFEVRHDRFNVVKHSTLQEYERELGTDLLASLFKFCCVRNPWERAISYFFSPHRGLTTWDRLGFLALLPQIRPAVDFVQLEGKSPGSLAFKNVDFVIRFESLQEGFNEVCSRLDIPPQDLPMRNVSSHNHYTSYYDSELLEAVRDRFHAEVQYFGYRFPTTLMS